MLRWRDNVSSLRIRFPLAGRSIGRRAIRRVGNIRYETQGQRIDESRCVESVLAKTQKLSPHAEDDEALAVEARRILRSILRECTYIPDPFAGQWVARHVMSRFRKTSEAWPKHPRSDLTDENRRKQYDEAKHAASLLRRANEGERKPLLKVLLMAYGRIGKRRHELMSPLLSKVSEGGSLSTRGLGSSSYTSSSSLIQAEEIDSTTSSRVHKHHEIENSKDEYLRIEPHLTPQLRALLESQTKSQPPQLTRSNPRRLAAVIPALNAWQRPMPQSRIKNQVHKHYAELLDRLQVPLPDDEWHRLRDLATGAKPTTPAIPRRKQNTNCVKTALDIVINRGRISSRTFENREARNITPRFMRRLYAEVFAQCPMMEWETASSTWKVTWGHRALG